MRIIAGEAKGRPIKAPKGMNTRPTTDRIKESLFAILGNIDDSKWLDLFSGSGNIGLEAISRGAEKVVFIDEAYIAITAIKENIKKLGFENKGEIYKNQAKRAINILAKKGMKFDYIFLDPPYESNQISLLLDDNNLRKCLSKDGIIILEHPEREEINENYIIIDQRKYQNTYITMLK